MYEPPDLMEEFDQKTLDSLRDVLKDLAEAT
jgi:hypothetical protein